MTTSKMGLVLRELAGGVGKVGEGPIEVMTRVRDFNTVTVTDPRTGQQMAVPTDTLFAFTAYSFRELKDDDHNGADVWEFRVRDPIPDGTHSHANIYVSGGDLFVVRQASKVL